jgi:hypothetical protein
MNVKCTLTLLSSIVALTLWGGEAAIVPKPIPLKQGSLTPRTLPLRTDQDRSCVPYESNDRVTTRKDR